MFFRWGTKVILPKKGTLEKEQSCSLRSVPHIFFICICCEHWFSLPFKKMTKTYICPVFAHCIWKAPGRSLFGICKRIWLKVSAFARQSPILDKLQHRIHPEGTSCFFLLQLQADIECNRQAQPTFPQGRLMTSQGWSVVTDVFHSQLSVHKTGNSLQ